MGSRAVANLWSMCWSTVRSAAEFGWRLGLVCGEEGVRTLAWILVLEQREAKTAGGEVVGVGVRAADDESFAMQPGQVVAGPCHTVGDAVRSSGA
jgi:hypothetical protein